MEGLGRLSRTACGLAPWAPGHLMTCALPCGGRRVSHFLPREELLPEKRFLFIPSLPKASGSAFLGARVASLRPAMHCFGHTHFGWDMTLDNGTRYVQAALCNPSERLSRWHTLAIGAFGRDGPLLIWSAGGGLVPKMTCRWSGFYEHHERMRTADGREFQMARYAARFPRTDKRAVVIDPDFSHEGDGAGTAVGTRMRSEDPALRPEPGGGNGRWPHSIWRAGGSPL